MKAKDKITEQPSHYEHLEQMSVGESLGLPYAEAEHLLLEAGSVDRVLKNQS